MISSIKCKISGEQLEKPFQHGWKREVVISNVENGDSTVYYVNSVGKKFRTKAEIEPYLEDGLDINMFTFARKPLGVADEIIRMASPKGYKKRPLQAVDTNISILVEPERTNENPHNENVMNEDAVTGENSAIRKDLRSDDMKNKVKKKQSSRQSFTQPQSSKLNLETEKDTADSVINEVARLSQQLKEKDAIIEDFKICLAKTELELSKMQTKLNSKTPITANDPKAEISKLFPMLTSNQIALMTKDKKRVNWTCDEIANGFAHSFFSRRGYNFSIHKLQTPEPSVRTLQRWAENMTVAPGILEDCFVVLTGLRDTLTEGESQVILNYDEMKCKSVWQYNKTLDTVMGPHSQMQVVMARGLFAKFKQPIYIGFDKKVTEDLLNLLSTRLHKVRFNVVGCVSDNGGSNVGLWSECDVTFEKTTIRHPVTGEEIFMFSDCPHLLKLLRNWFLDGGFLLLDGTELNQYYIRKLLEGNTEISPIFKLSLLHLEVRGSERQNVRMASELFSHSVAQSLLRNFPSDEIAKKLAAFIELVNNWFDIMNSYSINGIGYKKPYGLDLQQQNAVLDEMYATIKDMRCFNKNQEIQSSLQIFQKGILMSITSLKALRTKMEDKFNYKYILTHRLNQDCLENLFSQVRGRNGSNDHPTPEECLNNIKSIILGKNPGLAVHMHANTIERDPDEYASSTFFRLLSHNKCNNESSERANGLDAEFLEDYLDDETEEFVEDNISEVPPEFLEDYTSAEYLEDYTSDEASLDDCSNSEECLVNLSIEILDDLPTEMEVEVGAYSNEISNDFLEDFSSEMVINENTTKTTTSTEDGLEYIAGWIAFKLKEGNPEFSKTRRESLPSQITDHTYSKKIGMTSSSWVDSISYGGLTKPTDQVLKWIFELEHEFLKVHGNEFNNRVNVKKELIETLKENCKQVPDKVINLFAKSRIYMRCKYLNKKMVEEALMKRIKKKAAKRSGDTLDDSSRSKAKKMKKIIG